LSATPPDTTSPAKVSGLAATAGNGVARLTWTDPADPDLDSLEITWTPGGTASLTVAKSAVANRANSKTVDGLANGTAYAFTVKAKDAAGNLGEGETVTATTDAAGNTDLEAPARVSGLGGSPGDRQATLSWTDPADPDLASLEITWTPGNGSASVAKSAATDRANTTTLTGLDNGTAYTFTVKAADNAAPSPNKSEGAAITLTPRAAALVSVGFTGLPQDETTTLNGTQNILSWTDNTVLTVSVADAFSAYRWVLDGTAVPGASGNSLVLNAENLTVKRHTLTLFVTKDGVEYAKSVTFTVRF
jgi:hypothetical protein